MNRYVYAIVKRIRGLITIDFINGGLPLTYEGLFEDGMWYFADTTGTKVVDQNDPDRSEWFVGTGNADGDIDLDIKMLAITDVVIPETVQLGVAFDVSGNYVMLEDKIVIEGYNGSAWVKLHVGDYIDVTGGSFTETVTLQSADGFAVNSSVTVRVRSYDGYALNGSDSTDVIATVTMNAITGMVDGTLYTLEGTTDSDAVEIWVDDGTGYAKEGDAVVVGSAWSYDITLSAGTYGIKAIDGTDSRGFAEQTGVVVASGYVIPTDKIYDDYSAGGTSFPGGLVSGDCFQSQSDADEIVCIASSATSGLWSFIVDTATKSNTATYTCTTGGIADNRHAAEAFNTTDYLGIRADLRNYTETFKYSQNNNRISQTATGGEELVGVVSIGGVLHYLMVDGKLYSSANRTDFSLTNDLSAVLPASTSKKPLAYDSANNYLFCFDITLNKIYCVDLATNTQLGTEFTPPVAIKGFVYHKGRLHGWLKGDDSKARIIILKNSDDA